MCGDLASELLAACPRVTILATSRVSLGVPGEITWRVPSLRFPWPDHRLGLEDLENFEAVELFLARARAARPAWFWELMTYLLSRRSAFAWTAYRWHSSWLPRELVR